MRIDLITTLSAPHYMIVEYAGLGEFRTFLREFLSLGEGARAQPPLTGRDLTKFAHLAARGMQYLNSVVSVGLGIF